MIALRKCFLRIASWQKKKRKILHLSVVCSLLLVSSVGANTQEIDKDWVKKDKNGKVERKLNYYEVINSGKLLPLKYVGKSFGGAEDDFKTIQDGIGVVVLSLDFDTKNGDTKWAISESQKLKSKYAPDYVGHKLPNETIWDFIDRAGSEEDKRILAKIREVLQDYSDTFAPDPDNTCLNGFIGVWGDIDCRNKNLVTLRKGWEQLQQAHFLDLRNNPLVNIDNLNGLTKLDNLYWDSEKITSFSGLRNLKKFNVLYVTNNSYLTNIDFLSNVTEFGQLVLQNNSNLQNLNGISNVTKIYAWWSSPSKGVFNFSDTRFDKNPSLTNISGLKNIMDVSKRLYLDNRNYTVKLPATAKLCSTHLLDHVHLVDSDGTSHQIDPNEKYDTICERLVDDGNVQPQNDCETGFSGSQESINCAGMGLERLSSGWRHLTSVGNLHLETNKITSFDNLSGLTSVGQLIYDYDKITDFSGLSNVTIFNYLTIKNNGHVENLNFLSNIQRIGFADITGNKNLKNVNAFSAIHRLEVVVSPSSNYRASLDLRNNESLTDISGLQNITDTGSFRWWNGHKDYGRIYLDNKNYTIKIPAASKLCATHLLDRVYLANVDGTTHKINPNEKYDTICERLVDDGNVQPQNDCETGFSGSQESINCAGMGLERLSSGWKHLSNVQYDFHLENNKITSFDNLSNLTRIGGWFSYDYDKISDFSGLSNITYMHDFVLRNNSYVQDVDFLHNLRSTYYILAIDGLPNLKNLNGLSNYTAANYYKDPYRAANGQTYRYVSLFIANNPSLTDISGLKNITNIHKRLYLDNRNYTVKIPAVTKLCSTHLLDQVHLVDSDGTSHQINPNVKYDTICERLVDDGNVQPQNDCETGFSGSQGTINCARMGLERLSSGWKHLNSVGDLHIENNNITSLSNLSGLTNVSVSITFDSDKISDFSGLSNLKRVNYLKIYGNSFIENVDFLRNLSSVIDLDLSNNANLKNINGLSALVNISSNGYHDGFIKLTSNQNLTDISGLKNLASFASSRGKIYLDNRNYTVKLPSDSWLCNDGFGHIKVVNSDGSVTDPVKSNICN